VNVRVAPFWITPLITLGACTGGELVFDETTLTLELSEVIPTVVNVTFEPEDDDLQEAQIEYGQGRQDRRRTAMELQEDGRFTATVVGLHHSTDYTFEVVMHTDAGEFHGDDKPITTGGLPGHLPRLHIDLDTDGNSGRSYYVTSIVSIPSSAVVLDSHGNYVWWYASSELDPPMTRAYLSGDRQWMIFLTSYPYALVEDIGTTRKLTRVRIDGSRVETYLVEGIHHDFVERPDGSIAVLRRSPRQVGDVEVVADEILEIATDGTTSTLWSLWDEPELEGEAIDDLEAHATHGNALDYDRERDVYYMGSRNLHTIFEVDGETSTVLSRIGGESSDYDNVTDEELLTTYQHQYDLTADSILVFDNGDDETTESRVVEYALDDDAGTAERIWEYATDPPTYCYALGDVARLDDGSTLVTWSTAGIMDRVSADGELLSRFSLELGAAFGYTTPIISLYPPL